MSGGLWGWLVGLALLGLSRGQTLNVTVFYPAANVCASCVLELMDSNSLTPARYALKQTSATAWRPASFVPAATSGCLSVVLRRTVNATHASSGADQPLPCFSMATCLSLGACMAYSLANLPSPAATLSFSLYPAFTPDPAMNTVTLTVSVPSTTLSDRNVAIFAPMSLTENPMPRAVPLVFMVGITPGVAGMFSSLLGAAIVAGSLPESVYVHVPTSLAELTYEPCLYNCVDFGPNATFGQAGLLARFLLGALSQLQATLHMQWSSVQVAGWDLGGLFACYTATLALPTVTGALCASPYLWWNRGAFPYQVALAPSLPLSSRVVLSYGIGAAPPPIAASGSAGVANTAAVWGGASLGALVLQTAAAFAAGGLGMDTSLFVLANVGTACPAAWTVSLVSDMQTLLGFAPWMQPMVLTAAGSFVPLPQQMACAANSSAAGSAAASGGGDDCDGMYSGNILMSVVVTIVSFDLVLFVLAWYKPWVVRETARPKAPKQTACSPEEQDMKLEETSTDDGL